MMKRVSSSSKPISASSPGRTGDKFPPPAPLMRFLRSNVGSRSGDRGRSRASPMFVSKKSHNLRHLTTKTNAAEATQEPSSPKVTCMGQVRVRRSSSKQSTTSRRRKNPTPAVNRCRWVPTPGLCCREIKLKTFRLRPHFENWPVFFRIRRNKDESFKNKNRPVSIPVRAENGSSFNTDYYAEKEDEDNQLRTNFDIRYPSSSSSAPPKNALLLTRCRSAPYRSSSLACRFWGSPLSNTIAEAEETAEQKTNNQADEENNSGELEDSTSSIDGHNHPGECGKVKAEEVEASRDRPITNVLLTRCKSEPARTGNKLLDPEGIFCRQTEFTDDNGLISESSSAQVCD